MIDAIIPKTVNIIPLLNALVPGLNIQNADTHIKNKAIAKATVK
jgi:hypothetical protein